VIAKLEPVAAAAASFITGTCQRECPADVIDLAKQCLADWVGVALGAHGEPAGTSVRMLVESWGASGEAHVLFGGKAPAAMAALVNGTYAHCLDFDDLHFPSVLHLSAPTWAAVLATGAEAHSSERDMLSAFVCGFEIAARLGGNGVGEELSMRGLHPTGVIGRLSASAAATSLLGLDSTKAAMALGISATQACGLQGSFGTDAKPLHAGRAAFDGVMSAQLARTGFRAAADLLDRREGGLANAILQGSTTSLRLDGLGEEWELRRNALKPYACCGFTHGAIDAARELFSKVKGREIEHIQALVHPLAIKVAGKAPHSPLEAKFSVGYCIALGLSGHRATAVDFAPERLREPALAALFAKVELVADESVAPEGARMHVRTRDGGEHVAEIEASLGNPTNPMSWDDIRDKFLLLTESVLRDRARPLFEVLRDFDRPGRYAEMCAYLPTRPGS